MNTTTLDYVAYGVRDGQDDKSHWTRVGAAFAHKDGSGYDIVLDAVPVNGRIVLREPKYQDETAQG